MNSGIYKITNISNNKIYIGSSINISNRKAEHFRDLKFNRHHSDYLQNSYNKYGVNAFKFEVLVKCPKEYLIKLEQWFIDNMKPDYNMCKIAGNSLGFKQSIESRLKSANSRRGIKQSKESIEKRILHTNKKIYKYSLEGVYIQEYKSLSEAERQTKISINQISKVAHKTYGYRTAGKFQWSFKKEEFLPKFIRKHTDESKRKMSEKQKNKIVSEETRKKMREKRVGQKPGLGIKCSEETKKKLSLVHKGKPKSEETKRKISEAHKIIQENKRNKILN